MGCVDQVLSEEVCICGDCVLLDVFEAEPDDGVNAKLVLQEGKAKDLGVVYTQLAVSPSCCGLGDGERAHCCADGLDGVVFEDAFAIGVEGLEIFVIHLIWRILFSFPRFLFEFLTLLGKQGTFQVRNIFRDAVDLLLKVRSS